LILLGSAGLGTARFYLLTRLGLPSFTGRCVPPRAARGKST
jgi:hypothetical protein